MDAIRVHETGGPEVLRFESIDTPEPGAGQALVTVEAAGVNYIDVYHRTGLYPQPLPFTLGQEAAGVVERLGPDVTDVKVGDRVAYASVMGAYARYAVVPADRLVPLPDGITFDQAAAAMLQGMTAQYLTSSTYPIQRGDRVLIHAAAGGTGLLLVQLAKRRGATVYGTVSTEEKAARAREAGADEVIMYTQADVADEVKRLTGGAGVHVVYDSVGKTTFEGSLSSLRPRGYLALFGQSSGSVPPFDPAQLAKGGLFLTRPSLQYYIATRSELLARAEEVLGPVEDGSLALRIERAYPLRKAAEAHRALESRATSGKLLLKP